MILGLEQVLTAEAVADINARLAKATYVDGKSTAGWHAKGVKDNRQIAATDADSVKARAEIEAALRRHTVFATAIMPVSLQLMFNHYGPGQSYGRHVDDAFMSGRRTDMALTLFLTDPSEYDGGDLVIEGTAGEQRVKLPAGSAIVYPATTLHRVEPVTRGERLACVGWIECRVRDASAREIVFDLERARRAMFQSHGKTPEFDLISKAVSNLLRRWGE